MDPSPTRPPEGRSRRPHGSGSIYGDRRGAFTAALFLRNGRKVSWRRWTYEEAEAALEEMVQLHREELSYHTRLYYIDGVRVRGERRLRAGVTKGVRFRVLERDGFRCVYCGATPEDDPLVIDHVQPVADGGTDDIDNLATACEPCNLGKAGRPLLNHPAPRRLAVTSSSGQPSAATRTPVSP